ncbi:MAG: carbohydrate ABC transporter permease [Oscillospiraceae bacterium]|nr:carbohydrate ABC transporter permease [Oscillospiraceae bacterium]
MSARIPIQNRIDKITPFKVFNHIFISVLAAACALPLILVLMISISTDASIKQYGYQLIPKDFSLSAYKIIFSPYSSVVPAYGISGLVTVAGTLMAVLITGMAAFALANKNVARRNTLAIYFFVPMVFNAGLVPWYMMCRSLGLMDNILALIVPSLMFSPFNMFLCRNYMRSLPDSLLDSAKIDGASDIVICMRIYFPLSLPVLATVTLFYGVGYWNDWFNAIMLVNDHKLFPLQYMLYRLQSEIAALQRLDPNVPVADLPGESLKMATTIVTIGPIIFLYPYLQRYFVRGLIIGGVKG